MISYKRLTSIRKHWLKVFVGFKCEVDNKKHPESELEIHRINQELGYSLRNVQVVCKKHHEIFSSAQRMAKGTQGR